MCSKKELSSTYQVCCCTGRKHFISVCFNEFDVEKTVELWWCCSINSACHGDFILAAVVEEKKVKLLAIKLCLFLRDWLHAHFDCCWLYMVDLEVTSWFHSVACRIGLVFPCSDWSTRVSLKGLQGFLVEQSDEKDLIWVDPSSDCSYD